MSDARPHTADYYRERARQIGRFALRARSPVVRLELLDIADLFTRMAAHAEKRTISGASGEDGFARTVVSPMPKRRATSTAMGGHP
jgi:hypothetical protein